MKILVKAREELGRGGIINICIEAARTCHPRSQIRFSRVKLRKFRFVVLNSERRLDFEDAAGIVPEITMRQRVIFTTRLPVYH